MHHLCPSDSKEKKKEYYERWKAKKLAADPDFFSHDYHRKVGIYGKEYYRKFSERYRLAHPEYFANWRNTNKEYHSARVQKWMKNHPEIVKAHTLTHQKLNLSIAEFCEVCPEDDVRKATANHHPDYNYPEIVVSCCDSCHYYLNDERSNKTKGEK